MSTHERAAAPRRAEIKRTPRPRDRKQQIVSAAQRLFAEKGYAAVSADEIARSVGITAGALYRHFDGKQDLLVHALIDALDAAAVGVQQAPTDDLAGVVGALTGVAGENRDLGVLWTREVRLLDDAHRAVVREHFFAVFTVIEERLALARSDLAPIAVELLTWSVLAVLTSVAYHRIPMTTSNLEFLRRLADTVCRAPIDGAGRTPAAPPRAGIQPQARRELILTAAARLFEQQGYAGTSMGDIGEQVGMSGAAIYRYYPTKAELLSAVMSRGVSVLQLQLTEAFAAADDEKDALGRLVDGYVGFASRNHSLIGILLSEVRNIPEDEAAVVRRAQREYLAEWEHLVLRCHPELTGPEVRILVQAVLNVVNDATRTAALREEPGLQDSLSLIGRVMLRIA